MRALLVFSLLLLAGYTTALIPPTQQSECENGGVFNKEESKCDCQSYWDESDCSKIVCVNGGYEDKGYCYCPTGYYGIHCDAVKLARPVEGVFNQKKSFNLYIHNELTDWYGFSGLAAIQNDIETIIPAYSYDSYNLIVSQRGAAPVKEFYHFDDEETKKQDFIKQVTELKGKRTGTYTCAQTDISYGKLLKTLQDNKIEDSVILMYTQYPPISKKDDLAELKKYLRAFRIKLNVLIGADDILLDCNSKKRKPEKLFDELTSLVHFTDGEITTFLVDDETDQTDNELLPSFIKASASPQSHARTASTTCKGADLVFQTDPYPNTYYIAVRSTENSPASISGTCSSGGEVSPAVLSYYGEFSLFTIRSGAQQDCKLTVSTGAECIATVYSVGGEPDVDSFDIFHSFTTTEDMDTDSISSFQEEEVFLTMHIEVPASPKYKIKSFSGTVTVMNEDEQVISFEKNLTRRSSTFDYRSDETFNCPADGTTWIQLRLEGFTQQEGKGDSVAVLNRMIHLNCEQRKAAVDSSLKLLRFMDEATTPIQLSTLVLMYSNRLPIQEFSNFILESVDANVVKDRFSQFGYLRFDAEESKDLKTYLANDFDKFKKAVYDNAPDKTIPDQENLPEYLAKLTPSFGDSIASSPDSLVSIAIEHSMIDPQYDPDAYAANLAQLANLGAKLLFIGNVDTVKIQEDTDSLEVYTRMAAVSAGHVVLMDMTDFSDDGNNPFYVSLALNDLYSFGPSQRLLAYSNLEWEQTSSTTSQSKPIGTLQIPKETTEVFVSLTLNVLNPSDVTEAFMLSIVLEGSNDRIALNFDDFKTYGSPGYVRSNLYTAHITVVGGESYDGTFTVLATTPYTGAHIRFWTARTPNDIIPDLNYVDFLMQPIQPNDYIGAALRVKGSKDEKINLRFLDENGEETIRLDHEQNVVVGDNDLAHFIPYFCSSNQSDSLSKDMYTVEIKYSSTKFTYFRPMLCTASGKKNKDICNVIDDDGNVFCQVSNPPFKRGPSGDLIDCSGVGQVYYDNKDYRCKCDTGFNGLSCESSQCSPDITHVTGERDAAYRTLTFVFIAPAGEEDVACSDIRQFYAYDAKKLFQATSYDNIWQYTFQMYFNDGTVKTMYRGPRLTDFLGVFDFLKSDKMDPKTFCGVDVEYKPIDIADVYKNAVESVGRNSRGIVFLFATQSFLGIGEEFQLTNLIVTEEFYQIVQAYQQHIYMVSPVITKDIVSLTTASGGIAVRMIDGFFPNLYKSSTSLKEFDKIINGETGWIGVMTEKKKGTKTWTIKDGDVVDLFIYSNVTPPIKSISDCGTGTFTEQKFPYDDDDDDKSISSVYSVTGPNQICLTFDDPISEYDLIQVVIISTKSSIQTALLGQGQGDVDKHSAGATTNSTKPIHISFDQPDKKVTVKPLLTNWREAAREDCVFAQEFIPFENPFVVSGPFIVDFDLFEKDASGAAPSTPTSSLSVPLVVTERIKCVNGVFVQGSYCKCEDDWSGPTCSQPTCQNNGQLNSHGDHCDCNGSLFGGLFCKDPNPPAQTTPEETTIEPTTPDLTYSDTTTTDQTSSDWTTSDS